MLRGLADQQIIKKVPYLDKEVENNPFYQDFLGFLKYVEENAPKLTQTKNLNLKSLTEINEFLIRKKPMEEKVGNYIFRVRSQDQMPYIRTLDALAEVLRISKRYKGRLRIVKRAKSLFDSLSSRVKFNLIWQGFIHYLSWAYLQYTENGDKIARVLQYNQEFLWLLLRDFDIESNQDWISLDLTLETIRKEFRIGWKTAYGDNLDSARWGTGLVVFKNLLEVLNLVQLNKSRKKFKFTDLGRKVIRFQVSEDGTGLPIKNWHKKQEQEKFKMPKWMECIWRRASCGKDDCPICGRIKRNRQSHIERGEDPDDFKSTIEDVGQSFKEVLEMIKKDAESKGFDITNIKDIQEPPEPQKFSLYNKVEEWNKSVRRFGNTAEALGEFWIHTEEAADLFWYANILMAKTYRQLCNRWEIENGDDYGEFDYQHTSYILKECLEILKKSLEILVNNYPQKQELNSIYSNLLKLEKQIIKI
jgi:hypothetical protein